MESLDELHNAFALIRSHSRLCRRIAVSSDNLLLVFHFFIALLCVLWAGLSLLSLRNFECIICIVEVKAWNVELEMLRPAATHLIRGLKVARQTEKLVKLSFRLDFGGLGRSRLFLKSAHRRSVSFDFFLGLDDFGALFSR